MAWFEPNQSIEAMLETWLASFFTLLTRKYSQDLPSQISSSFPIWIDWQKKSITSLPRSMSTSPEPSLPPREHHRFLVLQTTSNHSAWIVDSSLLLGLIHLFVNFPCRLAYNHFQLSATSCHTTADEHGCSLTSVIAKTQGEMYSWSVYPSS